MVPSRFTALAAKGPASARPSPERSLGRDPLVDRGEAFGGTVPGFPVTMSHTGLERLGPQDSWPRATRPLG